MTSHEILDFIKAELNYNPQFGNDVIIPLINRMVKDLAFTTQNNKAFRTIPVIADTYKYEIQDLLIGQVIALWYGQGEPTPTNPITAGYKKLPRLERETLGMGTPGYAINNDTNLPPPLNAPPYNLEININFTPIVGYYLSFEYCTWAVLNINVFDYDVALAPYVPEELHGVVADKVIARLKLRDRDVKTASAHFEIAKEGEERLADQHQEKVTFLEGEE